MMVTLGYLVVGLAVGPAFLQPVAWALTAQQIVRDLQAHLSPGSKLALASNATAYAAGNFTPRYDIAAPPAYAVAVKPMLATDVQIVVSLVAHHGPLASMLSLFSAVLRRWI